MNQGEERTEYGADSFTELRRKLADAYESLLGSDGSASSQEIRDRCRRALIDVGAPNDFAEFFADILQCECEINATLNRLHQRLGIDKLDGIGQEPEKLLRTLQELTRSFNNWKVMVDKLHERGVEIQPLHLRGDMLQTTPAFKALCSLQTSDVNLAEGDEIIITDTSQPNRVKIKTSSGEEGYIPTLCCLLPSPDRNAMTATNRLRVQLLASWHESVKKSRTLMVECLLNISKMITTKWKARTSAGINTKDKERVNRRLKRLGDTINRQAPKWDLSRLHKILFSIEKELDAWQENGTEFSDIVDSIAAMDKSVLCFQMLSKQLHSFQRNLENSNFPIRVMSTWDQLISRRKRGHTRYFELKMTMEEIEIREEVIEIPPESSLDYGSAVKSEKVIADQITSASHEVKKRFTIKHVVDPRNDKNISIQQAIDDGIVDQENGIYKNLKTRTCMPIPEAMDKGLICVEQITTTQSREETKAIGIITVKTQYDNRHFTITGVKDGITGGKLTPEMAKQRGVIDEIEGVFVNTKTKERIPLDTAVKDGWIYVDFGVEPEKVETEVKTYAVSAVVDQKTKRKIPFLDAVERGLIDRETGNYINNLTGEKVYVVEAIQRGFMKAKEIEETSSLEIDAENKVIIDRMDLIRRQVLQPLHIINAFRQAAGIPLD